ncbi:thioester reductase, putative, partial [Bodo saltans]
MYCLVRGKSEADASSRIFSNLMQYQLFDDCHDVDQWMSRVVPIVGDLAQDHFGLSVARFHELAAVVDCIVHNGALVNFSYPYVSLLKHFLEALPEARMYCLVRGKSEADASSRIFSNLMQYQLFDDCHDVDQWMSRVVPIVGDLAQDHFGLSVARFHELAAVVDCIVHNGALVNFSYPYVSLKAANVGGTVTALKLATTYRLKPVHFISTLSTVPTPDVAGTRTVSERLLGPASEDLHGGYTQTKWVAERLVTLATTSRNIPCTIIRPGRITGHSATGACNLDDFLNLFIKGCVEMAAIPEVEMPCEMTPVDFCAQAIFDIATKHFEHFASSSKRCPAIAPAASPIIAPQFIYHLTNTSSMAWSQIMKIVCRQGNYGELTTKPYVAWRHEHLLALNSTTHCALIPLVPMFGENFEEEVTPLDVRVDHLDELLKYSGTVCPPTSEALVMSYVKYFLERGFLPSV